MIPVYIFYSMFGFQRTGDQLWALADQLGRGLPARRHGRPHHADRRGPAARRRALAAAGLDQPGVRRLRPGLRVRDRATSSGTRCAGCTASSRRHPHGRDIFYYLTVYNEPITQPAEPDDLDVEGLLRGLYRYSPAPASTAGPALRSSPPESRCRGRSRRSSCSPRSGASPPTSGRRPRGTSCAATRSSARRPTCSHPADEPRVPYVTRKLAGRPVRSSPCRTSCARYRTRSRAGYRPR